MLVNLSKLIGPALKSPVVEISAVPGQIIARAWLNGEIIVRQQVDSQDEWTIYVPTSLLRPLSDVGEADINIVTNDGADNLAIDAEEPALSVCLPGVEEFVALSGVEDGDLLIEGEALSRAVQFAGPYHSSKKTITDHSSMYLFEDDGRLGIAGSNMFMVGMVSGSGMPLLSEDLLAIINDGVGGFRLIPWSAFAVGKPIQLFISKSGSVIKFEDGIEARIPWYAAKTSAWRRLFPLPDVKGWRGVIETSLFESRYRIAAAYSNIGTMPRIVAKENSLSININGPKGRINVEVAAEGKGGATHFIGAAGIPLRGLGEKANLVIPIERKMPADATGAGGMLFWSEEEAEAGRLRFSLIVMLANSRAIVSE